MNIPRDFIDQVLARIDIVEIINPHVTLQKKSGSNYFARCPFHQEKSASFSVSHPKQFYYCFGCGAHGNAIDFLINYEHLSFPEAIETLASLASMELPKDTLPQNTAKGSQSISSATQHYAVLESAAQFFYEVMRHSPVAIQYLKTRGISGAIAKQFQIGFAPNEWSKLLDHCSQQYDKNQLIEAGLITKKADGHSYYDRFRNRIMFPIQDYRGRMIGFGGRVLDQSEPKYLNSPETTLFQKGKELYGLYHALKSHRQLKSLIIVEGYMDVIALVQYGITNVVATLGTATTTQHLQRVMRYTNQIIFCFDGDPAGRRAAWRALETVLPLMNDELEARFLFLPDREDPDSLVRTQGKTAFLNLINDALSSSTFLFQTLAEDLDLSHLEGRSRFATLALRYIRQIPPGMYQALLLEELSHRTRIDLSEIKQQLHPPSNNSNSRTLQPSAQAQPIKPAKALIKRSQQKRTPLRLAITLLIQHPALVEYCAEIFLPLRLPGASFLIQLIEIIQKDPHITTGRLIERFRGEKEGKYISALAKTKLMIPEAGVQNEFIGAIRQLSSLNLEEEIERLLAKAAQSGLTQDEKHQLTEAIGKKKALFS